MKHISMYPTVNPVPQLASLGLYILQREEGGGGEAKVYKRTPKN